ncbi:protein-glutamate O-methyltransferase [Thioclava sp. A2]|uniref:CheR family methyltransferase n=1 Tax=Thioclava sp. FCG-A2 TaxID=3080562 RepID=UPI002953FA9A|nr:protein-glutamate O-methyltransferase [Thioclava sp. A2]MDV7269784.1 protein-glutamate O-methyltransferase [Thioclava sp. A2]
MNQAAFHVQGFSALTSTELKAIADILYAHAGIVIAPTKGSMVQSRLGKRLRALGMSSFAEYIAHLASGDGEGEMRQMVSALTTNVTHFFRENHHFETLRTQALPPLLQAARNGRRVRIWSAGCSTGQEAYSIAITLAEMVPDIARLDIRILATDIDPMMIQRGSSGVYNALSVEAVPEHLRKKYLQPSGADLQVIPTIRQLVTFRELNLHDPWPMHGHFDIIFCRNVVIYFSPADQMKLWKRFENILTPEGWLFVGHSERVPIEDGSNLKASGVTTYRLPPQGHTKGGHEWH